MTGYSRWQSQICELSNLETSGGIRHGHTTAEISLFWIFCFLFLKALYVIRDLKGLFRMIESEPSDLFTRFCHEHVSNVYLVAQYKFVSELISFMYKSWPNQYAWVTTWVGQHLAIVFFFFKLEINYSVTKLISSIMN